VRGSHGREAPAVRAQPAAAAGRMLLAADRGVVAGADAQCHAFANATRERPGLT
jgi:hypothetical protein